jgi:tetratricopeptide (TPR) repeat protein
MPARTTTSASSIYNKGLYDEAVEHFELALEIDPRMQVAERNLQICYFGTGHFEQLSRAAARLEQDPSDERARDELARRTSTAALSERRTRTARAAHAAA